MPSEHLYAALHRHDQEAIRKYADVIVPALERRIEELETELNREREIHNCGMVNPNA